MSNTSFNPLFHCTNYRRGIPKSKAENWIAPHSYQILVPTYEGKTWTSSDDRRIPVYLIQESNVLD